jgi:guanylate kinase
LVKALLARDLGLSLSVSCTTRAPRAGEQDGVHYHFIDRARFRQSVAAGELLEYAEVFGNLYGTREADVRTALDAGQDLILEIDWQGARQVRERFDSAVGIFILPPSIEELERRLCGRGTDSDAVIAGRMAQARDEMAHVEEYAYLVVNEVFDTALDALAAIVVAERQRFERQRPRLGCLLDALP